MCYNEGVARNRNAHFHCQVDRFRDFSLETSRFRPRYALVAQLDRALACGAKGRRFESYRVYHEKAPTLVGGFSWDGHYVCENGESVV